MTKFRLSNKRCFFHSDERAATCSSCYDLALEQQRAQVAREREQAHSAYLFLLASRRHMEIES